MRFEFYMALAAVLALLHDAFFIVTVFSLTKLEVVKSSLHRRCYWHRLSTNVILSQKIVPLIYFCCKINLILKF
ncbi:hypothetical protein V7151_17715 [Priestia megaterium]